MGNAELLPLMYAIYLTHDSDITLYKLMPPSIVSQCTVSLVHYKSTVCIVDAVKWYCLTSLGSCSFDEMHPQSHRNSVDLMSLQGLPYDATTAMALVYGGLLAFMGVLISWAAPACNNPIFAEIVPPHLRNMIYSFDRSACALSLRLIWLCQFFKQNNLLNNTNFAS